MQLLLTLVIASSVFSDLSVLYREYFVLFLFDVSDTYFLLSVESMRRVCFWLCSTVLITVMCQVHTLGLLFRSFVLHLNWFGYKHPLYNTGLLLGL